MFPYGKVGPLIARWLAVGEYSRRVWLVLPGQGAQNQLYKQIDACTHTETVTAVRGTDWLQAV